jgi:hypothetical protein
LEEDGVRGTTTSEDEDPNVNDRTAMLEDSTSDDTEACVDVAVNAEACVGTADVDASAFAHVEDEEVADVEAVEDASTLLIAACSSYYW